MFLKASLKAVKIRKERIKINKENSNSGAKNLIIGCADERFKGEKVKKSIQNKLRLRGGSIVIYFPGSIHDFVNGKAEIQTHLWNRIHQLVDEKGTKKIVIWQHGGRCLVYKEYKLSPEGECEKQIGDMIIAEKVLEKNYPDIEIILLYATKENEKIEFKIIR